MCVRSYKCGTPGPPSLSACAARVTRRKQHRPGAAKKGQSTANQKTATTKPCAACVSLSVLTPHTHAHLRYVHTIEREEARVHSAGVTLYTPAEMLNTMEHRQNSSMTVDPLQLRTVCDTPAVQGGGGFRAGQGQAGGWRAHHDDATELEGLGHLTCLISHVSMLVSVTVLVLALVFGTCPPLCAGMLRLMPGWVWRDGRSVFLCVC